jgi:hypothetical protein
MRRGEFVAVFIGGSKRPMDPVCNLMQPLLLTGFRPDGFRPDGFRPKVLVGR